ncbi:MAG: sulfite oxidase heme-binding subunit YedZ [Candidatus Acidiferrales bacterium]
MKRFLTSKWTKIVAFLLCLVPAADIALRIAGNEDPALVLPWFSYYLSANPIKYIEHFTGDWTLRFLVITLAIAPLRKILHLPQLIRFRRMFGLFAFFYVSLHFTTWIVLDHWQQWSWNAIWADLLKRPFIVVGFTGFLLLIPLAVTSTAGWIRRLGGKRWRILHRAIYITAVLGVIHYYWLVKSDKRAPLAYGAIFGVLFLWRFGVWLLERRRAAAAAVRKRSVSAESA